MLRCTDGRDERLKQATYTCLNLRTILFNHMFQDRCRHNKDGGREDDPTICFCELSGVVVWIKAHDEEDADIDLDVVFNICKVGRFGFYKSHKDNRIG